MPGAVKLTIVEGPLRGWTDTFRARDTFLFGRARDCHLRPPEGDRTVSRYHFVVEVDPPEAVLRDLGSHNGTLVNGTLYGGRSRGASSDDAGTRLPDVALADGDELRVGPTVFRVEISAPATRSAGAETLPQCTRCGRQVTMLLDGGYATTRLCQRCSTPDASDAPAAALTGELGPYRIRSKLGQGAMGAVYLAERGPGSTPVALKVLLAHASASHYKRRVFEREIEVTRSQHHPNIVQLYDFGASGSFYYFALEYCPGHSLDDLIERSGGRLPLERAAPLMLQLLDGLAFAHDQGFVHRDIKPQNVLLTTPEGHTAKLSDFGLAKSFVRAGMSGLTATGASAGTPVFMPREQLTNFKYVKPISDVWSIGATFYAMLTGSLPRPFPSSVDPIHVILHRPIVRVRERLAGLPAAVAEVVDRSVSDDLSERYETAGHLREALAGALAAARVLPAV
jgi:hypothetical protein